MSGSYIKSAAQKGNGQDEAAGLSPACLAIPPATDGQRIGLFGGSFNPPHAGHRLVVEIARRRLRLDGVWWIVTPGNPLKDHGVLRPIAGRIALLSELELHPCDRVTAFELALGIQYSADAVAFLTRRRARSRFVWIMGADSLATFHRWHDWRSIAETVPIAVVDRPGFTLSATSAPAARALQPYRLDEGSAAALPGREPPAWTFLHGPRSNVSSTFLRQASKPAS